MKDKIEVYTAIIYLLYMNMCWLSVVTVGFSLESLLIIVLGGMLTTVMAFMLSGIGNNE